jgi:heme exporter protein A
VGRADWEVSGSLWRVLTGDPVCCNATRSALTDMVNLGDMLSMSTVATLQRENQTHPATRLSLEGVGLSRGGITLIRDLSLTLVSGQAVFLVGPNGVGKTSLLRAMAGFVEPDAGTIHYGDDAATDAAPDLVGWLGHTDGLKPNEMVRKALYFWAELYHRPRSAVMPILRTLGTDHLIDRACGRLSRGQQRRIALARIALIDRPVWLLDEPAGPLDGKGRERLAALVAAHRERGGIVIAATHQVLDWPDATTLDLGALR